MVGAKRAGMREIKGRERRTICTSSGGTARSGARWTRRSAIGHNDVTVLSRGTILTSLLVAGHLAFDLSLLVLDGLLNLLGVVESDRFYSGMIAGQGAFLGSWLALGSQRWLARLQSALLLAALMGYAMFVGFVGVSEVGARLRHRQAEVSDREMTSGIDHQV